MSCLPWLKVLVSSFPRYCPARAVCTNTRKSVSRLISFRRSSEQKHLCNNQICLRAAKLHDTGRPQYLADLLQRHKSTKSTRSSSTQLLSVPRHNLSFGSRSSVSPHLDCGILWPLVFANLTHFLHSDAFSSEDTILSVCLSCPLVPCQCALIPFETLVLYKSFTYLLTYLLIYLLKYFKRTWARKEN